MLLKKVSFTHHGTAQNKFRKMLDITKSNLKNWNKNKHKSNSDNIRQECEVLQNDIDFDNSDNIKIDNFFNLQKKLINELQIEAANNKTESQIRLVYQQ